jgi:hypothetical protein
VLLQKLGFGHNDLIFPAGLLIVVVKLQDPQCSYRKTGRNRRAEGA